MSHITLVRHGQANTNARDEASYDRLSDLGKQQSEWLGAYLRDTRQDHPRVYCGTLTRHIQTAEAMGVAENAVFDPRLNELSYFTMALLLQQQKGVQIPVEREAFIHHMPLVFTAWKNGEIADVPETFAQFETRVSDALREIAEGAGPALVVTSGGIIANAMRHTMNLEIAQMARMALAIMNTSLHRLFPIGTDLTPVLFNAVPHLDPPDRHHAQTHL